MVTTRLYRITVVCLGNICRSPIGEVVLRDRVERAGLANRVSIDSAGTGDWHAGQDADRRTIATLHRAGYQIHHRARQITPEWLDEIDLLLAMDTSNYRDLQRMLPPDARGPQLRMMRSFDPALAGITEPDEDLAVPDPYYLGEAGFIEVLNMVSVAADGLVSALPSMLGGQSPGTSQQR